MKPIWKDYLFVFIQFLLFAAYFFDFLPKFKIPTLISYIALLVALLGFLISLFAVFELDKNLTVYPTPKSDSELITHGLYRFSRHPIYSGIILFTIGYAVFRMSFFKLILSILLWIWFFFKSRYEENQLQQKYPNYNDYRKKVGRFFPKF